MFDTEAHRPYLELLRELRLEREWRLGDWYQAAEEVDAAEVTGYTDSLAWRLAHPPPHLRWSEPEPVARIRGMLAFDDWLMNQTLIGIGLEDYLLLHGKIHAWIPLSHQLDDLLEAAGVASICVEQWQGKWLAHTLEQDARTVQELMALPAGRIREEAKLRLWLAVTGRAVTNA